MNNHKGEIIGREAPEEHEGLGEGKAGGYNLTIGINPFVGQFALSSVLFRCLASSVLSALSPRTTHRLRQNGRHASCQHN